MEAHSTRRGLRRITAAVAASLCLAFGGHALAPAGASAQTVPTITTIAPTPAPAPDTLDIAPAAGPVVSSTLDGVAQQTDAWQTKVSMWLALLGAGIAIYCIAGGAGC